MVLLALAQLTAVYHLGYLSIKARRGGAGVSHVAYQQEILVSTMLGALKQILQLPPTDQRHVGETQGTRWLMGMSFVQ